MQVRELMTANPYGVQASESVQHAAEQLRRHGVGALVVYDQSVPVGIITDRDMAIGCIAAGHQGAACPVREHMTADPIAIAPDANTGDALEMMGTEQVRRLIVRDGPAIAGIVTLGDLAVRSDDRVAVGRALARISQPVRIATAE
ncbi:MAG: CBS domain-containing protein [Dehalococcoidia bacterium]